MCTAANGSDPPQGSERWGNALPHPLDPNKNGERDNQKLGISGSFSLIPKKAILPSFFLSHEM